MGKTVLYDKGIYKNRFISELLDNAEICEVLLGKIYTEEDVDNLVYSQIYPYLYVDDTQTEVMTYICFEVNMPNFSSSPTIKEGDLIIWVYCHKDLMKYSKKDYLGTRVDILSDMVSRLLIDNDRFGIGSPTLKSDTYIFPQKKYYGRQLIYKISDFKVRAK